MRQYLESLQDTERFGAKLMRLCTDSGLYPVFFQGELGTGKTALIQAMVRALPGSENAEVSSPSFTIVNIYPTTPPVAHFDLYRLQEADLDESLFEYMDDGDHLLLVEWSEHLPRGYWPEDHILVRVDFYGEGRCVEVIGRGRCGGMQDT
jgi:tRNA threonylcarbamoyladenosine biosynthesis protein TsaE